MAIQNMSTVPSEIENLDAILADFDLDVDVIEAEEEIVIEPEEVIEPIEATSVVDEEDLADLDIALTRDALYEEQDSQPTGAVALPAPAPAKQPKQKGAPRAPRQARDISSVGDEFFVLLGDPADFSAQELANAKTTTIASKPTQVKVAEKFDNLFISIASGRQPSTYVMTAFDFIDKNKTMSSADLVGAYKASGLKEGTARSQTGQIMNLFSVLGIANRSGQTLTLNDNSTVAKRLRDLTPAAS